MNREIMLICLFLGTISVSTAAELDTPAKIKAAITEANSYELIGLGGRYGYMVKTVAKKDIIVDDIFPPKSVYSDARDKAIKELRVDDMATVSLRPADHKQFITSNSNPPSGSVEGKYIDALRTLFKKGNYFEAISQNIKWYYDNPDKSGRPGDRFDTLIKEGIKDALEIHVKNQLITPAQRAELIKRHQLDVKNPMSFNVILKTPLRDAARKLLLADTAKYPGIKLNKMDLSNILN